MMSRRLFTPLVLLCGLTLILPPGWCCVVVAAPCCRGNKHKELAPQTPACPHCQSQTPRDDAPVKPSRSPSCCCEKELPTLVNRSDPTPQAVAILPLVEQPLPVPSPVPSWTPGVAVHSSLPPLHLLHCLWLC